MERRLERGLSLIEIALVVAVIGVVTALTLPAFDGVFADQRVKGAARSVADAFLLGRAEAIRTGNTHLVVFQNALGATEPIVIVNDGPPATADCQIDPGETVHAVPPVQDVNWGTSTGHANGTAAPDDPGLASASVATGASFTDASKSPLSPATWILFQPDGLPRLFTPGATDCTTVGLPGEGGGSIYLTNLRRDYAIVLSHLGTARVHTWDASSGAWSN